MLGTRWDIAVTKIISLSYLYIHDYNAECKIWLFNDHSVSIYTMDTVCSQITVQHSLIVKTTHVLLVSVPNYGLDNMLNSMKLPRMQSKSIGHWIQLICMQNVSFHLSCEGLIGLQYRLEKTAQFTQCSVDLRQGSVWEKVKVGHWKMRAPLFTRLNFCPGPILTSNMRNRNGR